MIELRWLKRMPVIDEKSIFIANHVLQYRNKLDRPLDKQKPYTEWQDVLIVDDTQTSNN